MTTKDKTGDRLAASIRRTRAGAEKHAEAAVPPAEVAAQRPTTRRKARAPAKKGTATPAKKSAAKQSGGAQGNYQSTGRVWPD